MLQVKEDDVKAEATTEEASANPGWLLHFDTV